MQVDPFEDFKAFSVALQEYWNYSDYAIAGALQREPGGEFKDNSVRKIHEGWCLAKRKSGPVVPDKVWADIAAACDRIGQSGEGAVELAQALDRLSNAVDPEDVAQVRYKLDQHKLALQEWLDKTEWVQKTCAGHELGMHRADVLKLRIESLQSSLEWAQGFANDLKVEVESQKKLLDGLRDLCGYVENGTSTALKISQDDATKTWHVSVGNESVYGSSFKGAVLSAIVKFGGGS